MFAQGSPFDLFHPDSIGSLLRKHAHKEFISCDDVIRIAKKDSRCWSEPVFQQYITRVAEGTLKAPRGRKPMTLMYKLKLVIVEDLIKERAAEIRANRKVPGYKRVRGDLEPTIQAADEIGAAWRLPRGRSLINAISKLHPVKF